MSNPQITSDKKTIETSWKAIVEIEQQLQKIAIAEDWSEVAKIAKQRHQLITAHFHQHPVAPCNAEFYHTHLNSFLYQEQQLSQVINTARKQVIKAVGGINHKRQAINAYQNIH